MKNYKMFTIIALVFMLAFVVPTSAVWSNGNWIDSEHSDQYFGTAKVVTDSKTGVTSKYNPVTSESDLMTYQGHVYGNLKSGHVLEGGERFLVSNDLTPNVTQEYKFTADGLFDDYFAAGNYTITLPQGTGSAAGVYTEGIGWIGNLHGEVAHINVKAGQTTYFTFIGNSVPTLDSACVPKYTIIEASYGAEHQSCQQVTIHHGNFERVWHHGHYSYNWVGDGNGDYVWMWYHYQYVAPTTEQQCTTDGTVIDVTSNVQSVVDRGITSFLFDNAKNPGGIFSADGSTRLEEISDPASGIEKHVSITYNAGCGTGDKTIEAMEYEVINL